MKFKRKVKEFDKLPKTRKQQFKDILKNDFALIVDISLLQGLFSIPLIVIFSVLIFMLTNLNDYSLETIYPLVFYFSLASIIFFGLRNMARNATSGLLIKRIYNEGCFIIPTFWNKIKENGLKSFFVGLFEGICFFMFSSFTTYLIYLPIKEIPKGLAIGMLALLFFFTTLAKEYFNSFSNIYELKFKDLLKNSYLFTLLCFPFSLLYFLCSIIIPVGLIMLSQYLVLIVVMILVLFYDGFWQLIISLYSIKKFDKYINKDNYPDYVDKGLQKDNKEEC